MLWLGDDTKEDLDTDDESGDLPLAEDALEELEDDEVDDDETDEGFGHLPETEKNSEGESKDEPDDDEDEPALEEDAEDVDYDTFDDIDEM